jgi:hypothetical protein
VDDHVEAARPLGERLADLAHAENAEPLIVETAAEKLRGVPADPFPVAHHLLAFPGAPRRAEHAEHGDFGGGDGDGIRRIADAHALGLGGGDVEMIEPDRESGEDLHIRRQPGDSVGVELLAGADQQRIHASGHGEDLVHGQDTVVLIEGGVVVAGCARLHVRRKAAGKHDSRSRH